MMILVLGHLTVEPRERDRVVEMSQDAVRMARATPGCLDFAVSADPTDDSRVNVAERWVDRSSLDAFRGDGPTGDLGAAIVAVAVEEYEV